MTVYCVSVKVVYITGCHQCMWYTRNRKRKLRLINGYFCTFLECWFLFRSRIQSVKAHFKNFKVYSHLSPTYDIVTLATLYTHFSYKVHYRSLVLPDRGSRFFEINLLVSSYFSSTNINRHKATTMTIPGTRISTNHMKWSVPTCTYNFRVKYMPYNCSHYTIVSHFIILPMTLSLASVES